ncbi:alpha-L-rhamnosidase B [Aspergillus luchuensis]|uniref:Alpha-L-rhamnosidase B n=1 Tax=Aspergillus kawachii TaxID=1069201 RepID=A0A146F8G9_ASPKA|nr:alpha-L-rhamnosidase B [Aspergillus luchuensis]
MSYLYGIIDAARQGSVLEKAVRVKNAKLPVRRKTQEDGRLA